MRPPPRSVGPPPRSVGPPPRGLGTLYPQRGIPSWSVGPPCRAWDPPTSRVGTPMQRGKPPRSVGPPHAWRGHPPSPRSGTSPVRAYLGFRGDRCALIPKPPGAGDQWGWRPKIPPNWGVQAVFWGKKPQNPFPPSPRGTSPLHGSRSVPGLPPTASGTPGPPRRLLERPWLRAAVLIRRRVISTDKRAERQRGAASSLPEPPRASSGLLKPPRVFSRLRGSGWRP